MATALIKQRPMTPETARSPDFSDTHLSAQRVCSGCYLTEAEWNQTGIFGCARCYETFAETIIPAIQFLHGVQVPEEWAHPKPRRTVTLPWATRRGVRI